MQALNIQWFQWLHAGTQPGAGMLAFALLCADYLVQGVGGLLLATALAGRPPLRWQLVQALLAVAIGALIAWWVHRFWPQPRPFMLDLGPLWLEHGPRAGLPSSHATGMFSLGFSLLLQGLRRIGGLVLLLGALVGWSRVYLGVHFPFDILAALPVGLLAAWLARVLCTVLRVKRPPPGSVVSSPD